MPELERYENIQNKLCMARIKASEKARSPDFSLDEIKHAVSELKTGRCMDPTGLIREVFKTAGDGFLLSVLEVANFIKRSKVIPIEWGDIWIKTLKKKKGSHKKLKNYRGIFIVSILSIIFEKLLKNRIPPTLKEHMPHFQNGGSKGKGVIDNLFLLKALIDHSKYMDKQLWITFYGIEKCFDSLWLENCINSLWDNGIKDDTLSLIYYLNAKANVIVKTPFGDTNPLHLTNIVKQGTVLGPLLNNCSLDRVCKESYSYHLGSVEIKPMEFVDDIADPNNDEVMKSGGVARYLGDHFNSKDDYVDLCKERVERAKGSTFELIALCREVKFGTLQIENMLILYQSVFLQRLIYNCESWSNMTDKDYQALQSAQLLYLRNVMEVPRGTYCLLLHFTLNLESCPSSLKLKRDSFCL